MDLGYFDLKADGGMRLPHSMRCKNCGKLYRYFPFSTITYANKNKVVEDLCDACITLKEQEGREKLKQLESKLAGKFVKKRKPEGDSEKGMWIS